LQVALQAEVMDGLSCGIQNIQRGIRCWRHVHLNELDFRKSHHLRFLTGTHISVGSRIQAFCGLQFFQGAVCAFHHLAIGTQNVQLITIDLDIICFAKLRHLFIEKSVG